jgi:hypothetical protein
MGRAEVFREKCLRDPKDRSEKRLRAKLARSGVDFLKLLDDPRSRRAHLIFLTHGAFYRGPQPGRFMSGAPPERPFCPWTSLELVDDSLR